MCSDNHKANTTEQVAMDTKARLERIERELPEKSPPELEQVRFGDQVLFESIHGVNW